MVTKQEKEMYLMLCGWIVEKDDYYCAEWWFPPEGSVINKTFLMTRIVDLDHAFRWQRQVDNFEWQGY